MFKFGSELWDSLDEENKKLRLMLFIAHSSREHLIYGDDGEMVCNSCGADFKRDTADELHNKIFMYNARRFAALNT
jgi:hypothetical protein